MDMPCVRCGKFFRTYPSRLREGKGLYCSNMCRWVLDVAARFFSFVNTVDGHWIWSGHRNAGGYGTLKVGRESLLAHRVAWFLATDTMPPDDADIGHTCDIRACVRNDDVSVYVVGEFEAPCYGHLFLATAQMNIRDMIEKGRSPDYRALALKAWETKRAKGAATHCRRGHALTSANVYTTPQGARRCRECLRLKDQRRAPRQHNASHQVIRLPEEKL